MLDDRPKYPVGVNAFVVRDGKLLLGKRKDCSGHGTWGLPGGHLEYGEAMIDAVGRELLEETGLCATSFEFLNIVNDRTGDRQYMQIGFLAIGVVGEPELCEPDKCECWEWFDLQKLPDDIFIGHKRQIEIFVLGVGFSD
jgi:8-oxo-dGTP diphosphatase